MNSEKVEMNIFEIEEYAKKVGYDSLNFFIMGANGFRATGSFLDAYFGMILIPDLGEGFIMLNKLREHYGNDYFTFIPLDE